MYVTYGVSSAGSQWFEVELTRLVNTELFTVLGHATEDDGVGKCSLITNLIVK